MTAKRSSIREAFNAAQARTCAAISGHQSMTLPPGPSRGRDEIPMRRSKDAIYENTLPTCNYAFKTPSGCSREDRKTAKKAGSTCSR